MFEKFLNDVFTELAMRTATKTMDNLLKWSESSSIKNQAKESEKNSKPPETPLQIWEDEVEYFCGIYNDIHTRNTPLSILISSFEMYNRAYNKDILKKSNYHTHQYILENYDLWMKNFETIAKTRMWPSLSDNLLNDCILMNYFNNPITNNYKKALKVLSHKRD